MHNSYQRAHGAAILLLLGSLVLTGCGTQPLASAPAATQAPAAVKTVPAAKTPTPSPAPSKNMTAAAGRTAAVPSADRPVPAPLSVSVPAIGLQSPLVRLQLRADGALEVPPTVPGAPAGWYSGSPSPGEVGPAVFLGHVNATDGGPGVFANLRAMTPGTEITVHRADRSAAVFTVARAAAYSKNDFPTLEVYGNTKGPELRLITCDGYDPSTGLFNDNYVVYAKLKTATRH